MSVYTVHYIPKYASKHTVNENNENLQYFNNKPITQLDVFAAGVVLIQICTNDDVFCSWVIFHTNTNVLNLVISSCGFCL